VPLSEHEQRHLEQIEQALYREDPKFGRFVRSSHPRVHYRRKLVQALIGVLIGGGLLAAGVVTHHAYFDIAGAVVLVLSLLWAAINWRQHTVRTRHARAKVRPDRRRASAGGRGGQRRGRGNRGGLMERLEERWRRRQEGDRRM
jgi:hypothetical protein